MNLINPYRFAPAGVAFDGFGNASRSFDGLNDYIVLGDVLDSVFAGTGKQWTFTAWIKPVTLNNDLVFSKWDISLSRAFIIRITTAGDLAVSMSSDGTINNRWGKTTDTTPISTNTWHHIAVSYDQTATGDYLRLWVDGVEDTTPSDYLISGTFTSIYDGTADLQISSFDNGSGFFDGNIADVRVYDTEITDSAIVGLSNGTDYQTNLVGWWLDDDNDVLDNAGTNDGTNNGSNYSTDGPAD